MVYRLAFAMYVRWKIGVIICVSTHSNKPINMHMPDNKPPTRISCLFITAPLFAIAVGAVVEELELVPALAPAVAAVAAAFAVVFAATTAFEVDPVIDAAAPVFAPALLNTPASTNFVHAPTTTLSKALSSLADWLSACIA